MGIVLVQEPKGKEANDRLQEVRRRVLVCYAGRDWVAFRGASRGVDRLPHIGNVQPRSLHRAALGEKVSVIEE